MKFEEKWESEWKNCGCLSKDLERLFYWRSIQSSFPFQYILHTTSELGRPTSYMAVKPVGRRRGKMRERLRG